MNVYDFRAEFYNNRLTEYKKENLSAFVQPHGLSFVCLLLSFLL
jgi:hypothetical protein